MEEWQKKMNEKGGELNSDDMSRSARYARDLVDGLAKVEQFPLGVTIFGSARFDKNDEYYKAAENLGKRLAQNNHTVITGGGPGVMEAANRGAFEQGGRTIGFNIHLATEQDLNPYTTDSMEFHYFFSRKLMMTLAAKVYVFFPGGFGTMDEFAEILELKHTGKSVNTPIFLFGSKFWKGLDDWFAGPMSQMELIETGQRGELREMDFRENSEYEQKVSRKPAADEHLQIAKNARDLYTITDDIEEIIAAANAVETENINHRIDEMMRDDVENYRI